MIAPLEDLRHEHRLIERVLSALEEATRQLRDGDDVAVEPLQQALQFVRGFADGCHHAKEEHGLFPALAAKNPAIEQGPVRVLTEDHEAGRQLIRELEDGLNALQMGRPEGRDQVVRALTSYTHMLRRHIAKEEEILFPLSDGLLSEDDSESLAARFRRVEEETGEGAHERYEGMVEQIELALLGGAEARSHHHH